MPSFDSVVVGAGPAGLSAATELSRHGSCLLLDRGPLADRRSRNDPQQILSGVGGAGLFSDGKHSFFPSATALWQLPERPLLMGAFDATAELLRTYGVEAPRPSFDSNSAEVASGAWQAKLYPALYVSFESRLACIEALWSSAGERWADSRLLDAGRSGAELVLEVEREHAHVEVRTRHLVLATGRWSPRSVRAWLEPLGVRFAFQRVEFGVRLEMRADDSLFAQLPGVDGKMRFVDPDGAIELRTFCTCRNGEVVLGEAEGLRAFSGRADGPSTGFSNVGLLLRVMDSSRGAKIARAFERAEPSSFPLERWPGPLASIFGDDGERLLTQALERFRSQQLGSLSGARVHAPCIEGVGDYPLDDGSLKVAPGIWVAGDLIGRFRGIVASMVSGRYAARSIISAAS
jgi:hypothetical protein